MPETEGFIAPSLRKWSTTPREAFTREQYAEYKINQDKKLKILVLIQKFYHQIRYGCVAADCEVTTCRTHRSKRTNGVPYRVPTQVTARAISTYLASLDQPYRFLCQNTPAPRADPFDIPFPTSRILYSVPEYQLHKNYCKASIHLKDIITDSADADEFAKVELEEWLENQAESDTKVDLSQSFPYQANPIVDSKSFAQNVFTSTRWTLQALLQRESVTRHGAPFNYQMACQDPQYSGRLVFQKIAGLKGNIKSKSFLSGDEVNYELFNAAYNDPGFIAVFQYGELNLDLPEKTSSRTNTDFSAILPILATPSDLMFYGLQPSPQRSMLLRLGIKDNSSMSIGQQFFNQRLSQPLLVLCMEFAMLRKHYGLDIHQILQALCSSIKTTAYSIQPENNLPVSIAAHMVSIAIAACLTSVLRFNKISKENAWWLFEIQRQDGHILSDTWTDANGSGTESVANEWAEAFEEPVGQYLFRLILRSFASHNYRATRLHCHSHSSEETAEDFTSTGSEFVSRLRCFLTTWPLGCNTMGRLVLPMLIEWARTIFLRDWDGQPKFKWSSDVGAAIDFLNWLYQHKDVLGLGEGSFIINVIMERIDYFEASRDWMEFTITSSTGHLLSFPWLFNDNAKVVLFRSINLYKMFTAYENSMATHSLVGRMTVHIKPAARPLLQQLTTSMESALVLDIRRDNILGDAFNQLWRRQKRELFRPMKVRMGMEEGEEGVDMGGVQQEFFRLAIADALDPAFGLFTIDSETRMAWFQPLSSAPLYQYTLIGMLLGLALYNGITLTVTFPLAFYRKLLSVKTKKLDEIEDGWPALYAGLNKLSEWTDGKVEDVFLRSYTFSFDTPGEKHDIDMQKHMSISSWLAEKVKNKETASAESSADLADTTEPAMVTDQNRYDYICDYMDWLIDKSIAPQFEAFATGFYLPLQRKSLSLFTPESLQALVEGHREIDIAGLRQATRYEDGYRSYDQKIQEFWEVVESLSPEQHRQLLEFVTASPRVPVRGMSEVTFIIQRNGVGDERLPTSMTCFGRLLLPEYSSKELMAEKLTLAIENSTGFGTQ